MYAMDLSAIYERNLLRSLFFFLKCTISYLEALKALTLFFQHQSYGVRGKIIYDRIVLSQINFEYPKLKYFHSLQNIRNLSK